MLLSASAVVTPEAVLRPGWIEVADGLIASLGAGIPDRPVDIDLGSAVVVPGFVDMHVHGGGGGAFPTGDPEEAMTAIRLHRRHGTTSMVGSLVAAGEAELARTVAVLAGLVEDGELAGLHLEGPWLSADRAGAHDLDALCDPDPSQIRRILSAGHGAVRMATIAPERGGGIAAIRQLTDAGVIAAVGHTDATYEQTRHAIDAGATVATHLFNAMRPIHHREPGPAIALLEDPRVTVELIIDGVHLHPALYRQVSAIDGGQRVALVTDAMSAAGMPSGTYRLGALEVTVDSGVARLTGTDTIAGSTATMDAIFMYAVRNAGVPFDEALMVAARQVATTPASVLGLDGVGALTAGARADLVVLDDDLALTGVLHRGSWLVEPVRTR